MLKLYIVAVWKLMEVRLGDQKRREAFHRLEPWEPWGGRGGNSPPVALSPQNPCR